MANINKIKLSGTTYNIQDSNATKTVELTQAQYDALTVKDPNTFYIITDAQGADLSQYYTSAQTESAITQAVSGKQDTLISGTNIKTINNESILGSGNITIQGGGGSASSAITSGDTNPVQGGVLFDELRIPITSEVETILEWENYDGGETTNYPSGVANSVVFEVYSEYDEGNGYSFRDSSYEELGEIVIEYNSGVVSVTNYNNVTYSISGNVVTVSYPSIAANVDHIASSYDNNWTVKAYTSGIVYEPLIDQVSANTISIQGKQDTLSAGTGIDITDNVISATGGGGKSIVGGRGITVTTGETADTVSLNLPISAGTGTNSIILGSGTASQTGSLVHGIDSQSRGTYSNVFGYNCDTNSNYGFTAGGYLTNTFQYGARFGKYNNNGSNIFEVGNGFSFKRHNAFEIRENGDIYIADTNDTETTHYYDKPMIKLQDSIGGTSYSAGTGIDITNDVISVTGKQDTLISGTNIKTINNESLLGSGNIVIQGGGTISIDQTVISGSTNAVAGGAVYDQLGGMKIVKLTESEYAALVTKDDNTLYCVVPDPSN